MTPTESIDTMVDRIVRDFQPLQVILFGSLARGAGTRYSDVDLLVVLSEAPNKREAAIAIRRTLCDLAVCKDILVTTPSEIMKRGAIVGTALAAALREGKVLYDRP